MSRLLKKLAKVGVAVGAVKTGQKINEQYKANNPDGVQDVNGDGVVDYKDKAAEIAKAAGQVFRETEGKVKDKLNSL